MNKKGQKRTVNTPAATPYQRSDSNSSPTASQQTNKPTNQQTNKPTNQQTNKWSESDDLSAKSLQTGSLS